MKVSIVIPIYYNEKNLEPLYEDLKEKVLNKIEYELVMVNDGSKDKSYEIMQKLAEKDHNIKCYSLSRNFGSHAAMLCGLEHCTGDCGVIKAADLQEPSELIFQMVQRWEEGYNVVIAAREGRQEGRKQVLFANMYYSLVRKTAFPNMPEQGFDIFLIDRKVIEVISRLDEKNSALTGQILWSGFKTDIVYYERLARQIGESKWTLKKKIRLVSDTLFSFSTLPVTIVSTIGVIAFCGSLIWTLVVLIIKLCGYIDVSGWTSLFIFNLFSFGVIMLTLGILGNYLWRTFDASRNRPPYTIEESSDFKTEQNHERSV